MEKRKLGKTGLMVSRLGVGLSEIGGLSIAEEEQAAGVLNAALDAGINLLDTAACYGNSEELIGRTVAQRRAEFVLLTKAGHVTGDYVGEPWTAKTITDSIERSLARMRTDHLDVVQLHSCGVEILERGEVIQALLDAKKAGKARYIGYSGDNEAARWAVESGQFDTLQTSFNLVDQKARLHLFVSARAQGMGIIAKRPIANAAWGADHAPSTYAAEYHTRARAMADQWTAPNAPDDRIALALGFALAHDAVDTAIVGTRRPEHMLANIALAESMRPMSQDTVQALCARFEELGADWRQMG